MALQRRHQGQQPPPIDDEFVDVSEEWIQLGSDWVSRVFGSRHRPTYEDETKRDDSTPRPVKH
jgi:hypothetical protein